MLRISLYIGAWIGLMLAVLQIQQLNLGNGLCGKWGCGPPVEAVLGMHLFWFALILPPSIFASRKLHWPWKKIGLLVSVASVLGLIGFAVYDYFSINQAYYHEGYIWQRYLLSLVSMVDVPVVQFLFAGVTFWFARTDCACCGRIAETEEIDMADESVLPVGIE